MLNKKPGAVSRPGAIRKFQFPEYSDSPDDINMVDVSVSVSV
jgi:hypothetical protein